MFKWFMSLLGYVPAEEVQKAKENLVMPEEAVEIMKAVENQELKDLSETVQELSERMNTLTIAIGSLAKANEFNQEMLVHVATLHEELLHQLDDGKVVMVKQKTLEDLQHSSSSGPAKKKEHMN